MRIFLVISLALFAFLLFSSKKCSSPEDENTRKEEIAFSTALDSMNKTFESDYLSEQSLMAFEIKAKQKLADFADYIQIYTDPSMDGSFKDHARQMILDLFISDTVRVMIRITKDKEEINLKMNELLKIISEPFQDPVDFILDSIVLSEPLHRDKELIYTGSLEFLMRYDEDPDTNSVIAHSDIKKVDIIAKKVRKPFGRDTLQVWQVYLGDIR